jgi:hypothetical protein
MVRVVDRYLAVRYFGNDGKFKVVTDFLVLFFSSGTNIPGFLFLRFYGLML